MRRPSMVAAVLVGLAVLTAASSASAMYHPTVGRWVARDPIGYEDGLNLDEYAFSRPISGRDPLGLSGKTDFEAALRSKVTKSIEGVTVKEFPEGSVCEKASDLANPPVGAVISYRATQNTTPGSDVNVSQFLYTECTVAMHAKCECAKWTIPVVNITIWTVYDWEYADPKVIVAYDVRIHMELNSMDQKLGPKFNDAIGHLEKMNKQIGIAIHQPDIRFIVDPRRFWVGEAIKVMAGEFVPESVGGFAESGFGQSSAGGYTQTTTWEKLSDTEAQRRCVK